MIAIPLWSLPLLLTIGLWAWGILAPIAPARGDYDFGPAFTGMARLVTCVVGTLVFWLVYFMAKAGGVA